MAWTIEYLPAALKALAKLDRQAADRITRYLDQRVASLDNPRDLGQALTGPLGGLWRYRVGDHRVICEIRDRALVILVVRIGDRKEVYR